jgi:hypothetical protein
MHLLTFEFNDSPKCPKFIRESILEVLGDSIRNAGVYDVLAPRFSRFCEDVGAREILEFGAGSGESTAVFLDAILAGTVKPPHIYISDLYPMADVMAQTCRRYPAQFTAITESVDLCNPPATPPHDMRMVLSAFHHFDTEIAQSFLRDSQEKGVAVFIAEPFTKTLKSFFPLFIHGFTSLARNGIFARKMRGLKFLFTFLVPLIPMCLLWDGLISMIRMYDERGFQEIVDSLPKSKQDYKWHYVEVPVPLGGTASVFMGRPVV